MTMEVVEAAVDLSRARLGVDRIDLLQFHWCRPSLSSPRSAR